MTSSTTITLTFDSLFPRRVEPEGASDVALALLRGEPDLAHGRAHAFEHEAIDRHAA
jgi:hypothetical protein